MSAVYSSTTISVNILALVLLSKTLETNLSRVAICSLPPNPGYGDCTANHEERFYFDVYELRCKKFLFLNCHGGNENRFATEAECYRFCSSSACEPGESLAGSSSHTPLICEKPSMCPQGFRCVYNELFRKHYCCGSSNIDGVCPMGFVSYASPATDSALSCSPSAHSDHCPEGFVCVGREQNGYCCKPRDICPLGQSPDPHTSSVYPVKCSRLTADSNCSKGFECITPYRAFWGFCCSSNITGWCPNNSRPFVNPDSGQPQKCTVNVTTCRVGYSCQSKNGSIVGFCCPDSPAIGYKQLATEVEEPRWLQNLSIADGLNSAIESSGDSRSANHMVSRSLFFDLMTVLTCPDTLLPSFLTDSQLIRECTESDQMTTTCPEPARCVKAPRDILQRSVCCSAKMDVS